MAYNPSSLLAWTQGGNTLGATSALGSNDAQNVTIETNNTVRATFLSTGELGIGLTPTAGAGGLQIGVSERYALVAIADTASGPIGTAAATVDVSTGFLVTQTTASQTLTLPSPTVATGGRTVKVLNDSTSTATFTMLGTVVGIGSGIEAMWDGAAWALVADGGIGSSALNAITAATATNSIDSLTFAQTWAWSTATTQTPLTLTGAALTTGSLLALSSASTGLTGSVLSASSASTAAVTTGLVDFTFSGAHTGTGFYVDSATATGTAVGIVANSATTGSALTILANGLTSGTGISLLSAGTAGLTGQTLFGATLSGANGTAGQTTYAAKATNAHTGAGTNVALQLSASGGTNNYGLIVAGGKTGLGTTTPAAILDVLLGSSGATGATARFGSSDGDFDLFVTNASPETVTTGSVGDISVDTSGGVLYFKQSGAASATGWRALGYAGFAPFEAKTGAYTVVASDNYLTADATGGSFAITLPAAATVGAGKVVNIKRIDSSGNTVSIDRSGADTIDGATSLSVNVQYLAYTLVSDGNLTWNLY